MSEGRSLLLTTAAMALMLVNASAGAEPYTTRSAHPLDPVSRAISVEAKKVGDFMTGPRYHAWQVSEALTCEEIYEELLRLVPRSYSYRPAFYDDPRNAAIGALGFVFPPMFYAWGYTALDDYSEGRRVSDVNMRIDGLRRASARQDCWVKQ